MDYTNPFAAWSGGGGVPAEAASISWDQGNQPYGWGPATTEAYTAQDDESWNGTDTDTSSDYDEEIITEPGLENMSHAEAAEHIYMQYRRGKRMWRRFTGKPVCCFRYI